jgi:ABC-type polar amino acid transport system, ATPase component
MSEPIIKIQNMNKWFGNFQVLKDVNLEVEKTKNSCMWAVRIW